MLNKHKKVVCLCCSKETRQKQRAPGGVLRVTYVRGAKHYDSFWKLCYCSYKEPYWYLYLLLHSDLQGTLTSCKTLSTQPRHSWPIKLKLTLPLWSVVTSVILCSNDLINPVVSWYHPLFTPASHAGVKLRGLMTCFLHIAVNMEWLKDEFKKNTQQITLNQEKFSTNSETGRKGCQRGPTGLAWCGVWAPSGGAGAEPLMGVCGKHGSRNWQKRVPGGLRAWLPGLGSGPGPPVGAQGAVVYTEGRVPTGGLW